MAVTLNDVAKEASVSISTVSKVINLRGQEERIPAETRKRVLEAVRKCKYRPNAIARTLAMKRSRLIGVMVPSVSNPFFAEVLEQADRIAIASGYEVMPGIGGRDAGSEKRVLKRLVDWKVDGLITWTEHGELEHEYISEFGKGQIPFVVLGYEGKENLNYSAVDRELGGYIAAEHLAKMGHQRIGVLGAEYGTGIGGKVEGMKRACTERGITLEDRFAINTNSDGKRRAGYEIARSIASEKNLPTAFIALNDLIALGAVAGFMEAGRRMPQDVAIVGFDNIEEGAIAPVPLTTVAPPMETMIREAVELIIQQLEGKGMSEVRHVVHKPKLIVRKSCGANQLQIDDCGMRNEVRNVNPQSKI